MRVVIFTEDNILHFRCFTEHHIYCKCSKGIEAYISIIKNKQQCRINIPPQGAMKQENGREAGTNKCKNLLSSLWKCSWTRVKTVPTDVIYSFNWFNWFVVSCSLCQKILQCLLELYVRSTFPWTIWVNVYSTASSVAMSLHQSVLLLFLVGQRMSDSEFNYPAGHILWVTTGY